MVNEKKILFLTICLSVIFLIPSAYASVTIFADMTASIQGIGSFIGELTYTYLPDTTATLSLSLTNNSNPSNGGYITAFVFNNPLGYITDVTDFSTNYSKFGLLGLDDNRVSASPFGKFDLGASLSGIFKGGGKPTNGIEVGGTGEFVFFLSGSNLDALSEWDFVNELSEKKTQTIINPHQPAFFCARFRKFDDGRSDKVPANIVPEPASLSLLSLGCLGYGFAKRKRSLK